MSIIQLFKLYLLESQNDYIFQSVDYNLWVVIVKGPQIPTKQMHNGGVLEKAMSGMKR